MELYADLHIHSCLSPCADDDMTPANICGMAMLKGLDMIAVTDHNCARNLPYVQEAADAFGLLLIPGMEITTSEEVHLLAYFQDVASALSFSEYLRLHLPDKKNRPAFFGSQLVVNADDEIVAQEESLLIGATDLPLKTLAREIRAAQGVPVPAHINRGGNGLLTNLGMMPDDVTFSALEVWRALPCPDMSRYTRTILHSSDAHKLGNILEKTEKISMKVRTAEDFLRYLRG